MSNSNRTSSGQARSSSRTEESNYLVIEDASDDITNSIYNTQLFEQRSFLNNTHEQARFRES